VKRIKPKLTYTVRYVEQEAPPELWERAVRAYAQMVIDAWRRKQNMKEPEQVSIPIEHIESDSEDW
jgi:hypothetical protein